MPWGWHGRIYPDGRGFGGWHRFNSDRISAVHHQKKYSGKRWTNGDFCTKCPTEILRVDELYETIVVRPCSGLINDKPVDRRVDRYDGEWQKVLSELVNSSAGCNPEALVIICLLWWRHSGYSRCTLFGRSSTDMIIPLLIIPLLTSAFSCAVVS